MALSPSESANGGSKAEPIGREVALYYSAGRPGYGNGWQLAAMLAFLCMLAVIPALLLLRSHANHSALGAAMWCGSVLIVAPVVGLSARRRRVAVFESGLLLGRMFVAREELQGWSLYDGMLDVLVRHRIEPQRMDGWYHTVRFARGDEVLLEEALRRAFPAAAPKRP